MTSPKDDEKEPPPVGDHVHTYDAATLHIGPPSSREEPTETGTVTVAAPEQLAPEPKQQTTAKKT